jgi:hypothetical protein
VHGVNAFLHVSRSRLRASWYTTTKPEGRSGVGRPKLGWLDDVEVDIKYGDLKLRTEKNGG